MNNKKGFTLIELLATIVVLTVIIGIATASALTISARTKRRMYESKVTLILDAAKLYAQDHMYYHDNTNLVAPSEASCSASTSVSVLQLYNDGKLKKDDNTILVEDPITGSDMTKNDKLTICMYKKNNRVSVKLNNCSEWKKNGASLSQYCS